MQGGIEAFLVIGLLIIITGCAFKQSIKNPRGRHKIFPCLFFRKLSGMQKGSITKFLRVCFPRNFPVYENGGSQSFFDFRSFGRYGKISSFSLCDLTKLTKFCKKWAGSKCVCYLMQKSSVIIGLFTSSSKAQSKK